MCSYIVEKASLVGSAKGPNGWMKIDTAHVYYDHPYHAPLDHALGIDFINVRNGGRERVAVELSAESARELGDQDSGGARKRREGARRSRDDCRLSHLRARRLISRRAFPALRRFAWR